MIQKAKELYKKHERWAPIVFFIGGFIFDAVMLRRIDELMTILQQAAYILIIAILIGVELTEEARGAELISPPLLGKVWKYREALMHFLMGTLLNAYTIFYFKSASALTSFIYIILLAALLMIHEFKRFGKSQSRVHIAFLSLCVISYFICLVPIVIGFIGMIPFLIANIFAVLFTIAFVKIVKPKIALSPGLLKTHVIAPFFAIQVVFAGLYFAHMIPPVPLSVNYLGIFHDVKKEAGEYQLTYTRPKWKFWEHGDQTFLARPGDTIYCFVRIFCPTRFKDQIQVRWFYDDPRLGWTPSDAIPITISGGREEGYRGITKKNNYQPGEWRVQVETKDGREIGRIGFEVIADTSLANASGAADDADPVEPKVKIE